MKLSNPSLAVLATVLSVSAAHSEGYNMGMQELKVADEHRPLDGFLWYPTEATEGGAMAHGNAVWQAVKTYPNAAPVDGARPLVLLSHGMFGNARNQAWLAQALVAQGYIVAAIDHPGTSTFSRDADQRRALWERPKDISRSLDALLAMDGFGDQIDQDRIFMAGHSLGGFTAVALAGGRYAPEKVDAFCAENPNDLVCGIFARWEVAVSAEDRAAISEDLSDARISRIAVFDLGGAQTFSPESLAAIETPLFVIGAPAGGEEALNLNVESRALAAQLSADILRYEEPEGMAHFDFLGQCTPIALDILKAEEPDDVYVCERGMEERAARHEWVAQETLAFFGAQ